MAAEMTQRTHPRFLGDTAANAGAGLDGEPGEGETDAGAGGEADAFSGPVSGGTGVGSAGGRDVSLTNAPKRAV